MRTLPVAGFTLLLVAVLSCGDDPLGSNGTDEPTTGGILVSLEMSGGDMDAHGCTVTVDGGSAKQLNPGAVVAFPQLPTGIHEVTILDLAANCQVDGGALRSVTVIAGQTAQEAFTVVCDWRTRIAFISNRDGNDEVYAMNPDGTNQVNLTNHPNDDGQRYWSAGEGPVWSPDGNRIAFVSDRDGDLEIYVMNRDGSGQVNLTNHHSAGLAGDDKDPAWSPDGSRIAFSRGPLFVMNSDGTGQVNLTGGGSDPAWSPDGTRIAYQRYFGMSTYIIAVINADGTGQADLTTPDKGSGDWNPVWSPDGNRIAYGGNCNPSFGLCVMNPDGTEPLIISPDGSRPAWSPDSNQIAYQHYCGISTTIISVINADGTGQDHLTFCDNGFMDRNPVWSPDGARIAFISNRDGNDEVYAMNPDGTNQVNLTNHPHDDDRLSWSPDLYDR